MTGLGAGVGVVTGVVLALDENLASPGLLGFVVFALLGLATFFLIRSMNKQLRKIDVDGGAEGEPKAAPPAGSPPVGSPPAESPPADVAPDSGGER